MMCIVISQGYALNFYVILFMCYICMQRQYREAEASALRASTVAINITDNEEGLFSQFYSNYIKFIHALLARLFHFFSGGSISSTSLAAVVALVATGEVH